ncbi:hypothetical protein, partial [Heyndrickxia coagulans]|uniref:hypothetical protein n=1 Tax=Heyndrickxia coagulans TaxID=1398 RepID=UPI002E2365D3|nr:hypothetical protein [Heyndrickxia coagulans]
FIHRKRIPFFHPIAPCTSLVNKVCHGLAQSCKGWKNGISFSGVFDIRRCRLKAKFATGQHIHEARKFPKLKEHSSSGTPIENQSLPQLTPLMQNGILFSRYLISGGAARKQSLPLPGTFMEAWKFPKPIELLIRRHH